MFDASQRRNYGWDPKKVQRLKLWSGPPLSPCKIWWKSRHARRRERMKRDVFHFFLNLFLFLYITLLRLPSPISRTTSTRDCVGISTPIQMWFAAFCRGSKALSSEGNRIAGRWCYHTCRNARSPRKWVQSLCAPLRPFKSKVKENFYHSILLHVLQMCTRIKIFRYLVTGCLKKLSTCSSSAKSALQGKRLCAPNVC